MNDNFWRAVDEERHRKLTGEDDRRKRDDAADQREADRRQRETMGEDHPKWP